jgi:hypothetical protein
MQNEIKKNINLLNADGHIINEGWARFPYWKYYRSAIKASILRIKEWDYYAVLSEDKKYGITFTISDLGYLGLSAICFLDFEKKYFKQIDTMSILPLGKTGFPPDSESAGTIKFGDKKLSVEYAMAPGKRTIRFECPDMTDAYGNKGLKGEILLTQPEGIESMVIATSWKENRKAFYYNRKINCMPASGGFAIGAKKYTFEPARDFGVLDWGRGNWTYKNRWYWGSASGLAGGVPFGWNIGYGFSDRTPASENVIFYDGKAHKIEEVTFHIDTSDYLKPWKFTSSDSRFEMDFKPVVDRSSAVNLLILKSMQHQVFGYFTGKAVLDDGRVISIDNFLGFAEDVLNWY